MKKLIAAVSTLALVLCGLVAFAEGGDGLDYMLEYADDKTPISLSLFCRICNPTAFTIRICNPN